MMKELLAFVGALVVAGVILLAINAHVKCWNFFGNAACVVW